MALIEIGLLVNGTKDVIFSNTINDNELNDVYDINSLSLIDWTISEGYNEELKEIRFKNHILMIKKFFISNKKVFFYAIINFPDKDKLNKIFTKFFSDIDKKVFNFNSINDFTIFCFKHLTKYSVLPKQFLKEN